ncbi:MAG TPA: hypothetical protein ACFCUC_08840 [Desulfobacterales bacterium]
MNPGLDPTVVLTGMLPAVILAAAVLTALASALLLRLYRRAVLRAMNVAVGTTPPNRPPVADAEPDAAPPLTVVDLDAGSRPHLDPSASAALRRAEHSLRYTAGVYLVGGLLYALIFASAWMVLSEGGFLPVRFSWLWVCYSWPIVPALAVATVSDPRRLALVAGGYGLVAVIAAAVALMRNPVLAPGQLIFFWMYANAPGTLLLLAFLRPRVRAVGPLVLAFMLTGVTGAALGIQVVGSSDHLMRGWVAVGSALGLGATALFILLHLAGFALFGVLGWILLRWIGRRYRLKQTSDQSVILDSMWLMFGVVQSITLVFEGWMWIFTGIVAFAIYKLAVLAGFKCRQRSSGDKIARVSLLLLRVFSLGRRSEQLFRRLSKQWLQTGNIGLIAGPDLVTATVEPHEFMDFLSRRLSQRFIRDEADLHARLSQIDPGPDPDGRHRVNEFFCHADTWQMTMTTLAAESRSVMMDLRSFSPANQGCLYELQELLRRVPLSKVLLVIDAATDRSHLEQTLQRLWAGVDAASPNRQAASPEVRIFDLAARSKGEMEALLQQLFTLGDTADRPTGGAG